MKPMTIIVRTLGRIITPFTIVFGLYIALHGHLTPGGGFQGGAVIASVIAMLVIAYGRQSTTKTLKKNWFAKLETKRILAFLGVILLGLGTAKFYHFLALGHPHAEAVAFGPNTGNLLTAGWIPWFSMAVGFEVFIGLGIIVIMLALALKEVKE